MAQGFMVAAAASGQGKSLVTAALARALMARGRRVRLFKMGPDYLDPRYLQAATGLEVRQLDYWLLGEQGIARELQQALGDSEATVIVEGMMGLFDGRFASARLAKALGLPVLLVMDASAMAQTFGALVGGLVNYDPELEFIGVVANKVGSDGHGQMLRDSIRGDCPLLGWLPRSDALEVKERHLGIDTDHHARIRAVAETAEAMLQGWLPEGNWPDLPIIRPAVTSDSLVIHPRLAGVRIAVARDAAFQFIYPANIEFLRDQGAEIRWFSPLEDRQLPACDSLYLPGGYPELHLLPLSRNQEMLRSIDRHIAADKPCLAECGGMLYLADGLAWQGNRAPLVGALPAQAEVTDRLQGIGYQQLPQSRLRGHSFHHGRMLSAPEAEHALTDKGARGEPVYRRGRLVASFVHWYFPSDGATLCGWLQPNDSVPESS